MQMEADGLVRREPYADDMRQMRVSLTQRGNAANKRLFQALKETDAVIMQSITSEEDEILTGLLLKMRDYMLDCGGFSRHPRIDDRGRR